MARENGKSTWVVCCDDGQEITIEAERYFLSDEHGVLKFMTAGVVIWAFARGGWLHFKEVSNGRAR